MTSDGANVKSDSSAKDAHLNTGASQVVDPFPKSISLDDVTQAISECYNLTELVENFKNHSLLSLVLAKELRCFTKRLRYAVRCFCLHFFY